MFLIGRLQCASKGCFATCIVTNHQQQNTKFGKETSSVFFSVSVSRTRVPYSSLKLRKEQSIVDDDVYREEAAAARRETRKETVSREEPAMPHHDYTSVLVHIVEYIASVQVMSLPNNKR